MRRTLASLAAVGLGLFMQIGVAGNASAAPAPAPAGPEDFVLAFQCNSGGGTVVYPIGSVRCEGGRFAGAYVLQ